MAGLIPNLKTTGHKSMPKNSPRKEHARLKANKSQTSTTNQIRLENFNHSKTLPKFYLHRCSWKLRFQSNLRMSFTLFLLWSGSFLILSTIASWHIVITLLSFFGVLTTLISSTNTFSNDMSLLKVLHVLSMAFSTLHSKTASS